MRKEFFLYTRRERRGIVVLLFLIVMVLLVRFTIPYWNGYYNGQLTETEFERKVLALNDSLLKVSLQSKDLLFSFNPNNVSESELMKLGFSKYQTKSLIGYREKVGVFKEKGDLLRVYGIDSSFLSKIGDYIQLPSADVSRNDKKKDKIKWIDFNEIDDNFVDKYITSEVIRDSIRSLLEHNFISKNLPLKTIINFSDDNLLKWLIINKRNKYVAIKLECKDLWIELNNADTTVLKKLKGIGSKLASRIVRYRDALNGFYCKEQLKEVYGISDAVYNEINEFVYVDADIIKKFNPGQDKYNVIARHYYFKEEQAKELVNLYRKKDKPNINDIRSLVSLSDEDVNRVKNYLIVFN